MEVYCIRIGSSLFYSLLPHKFFCTFPSRSLCIFVSMWSWCLLDVRILFFSYKCASKTKRSEQKPARDYDENINGGETGVILTPTVNITDIQGAYSRQMQFEKRLLNQTVAFSTKEKKGKDTIEARI